MCSWLYVILGRKSTKKVQQAQQAWGTDRGGEFGGSAENQWMQGFKCLFIIDLGLVLDVAQRLLSRYILLKLAPFRLILFNFAFDMRPDLRRLQFSSNNPVLWRLAFPGSSLHRACISLSP
jgi:hypothetical protein